MTVNKTNLLKINMIIITYLLIGILLFANFNFNVQQEYFKEYIVLLISYFTVAGIFILIVIKYNIDIFQPFILISILYICIFSITPMLLIVQGKTDAHGVDVMAGCIKATIIYMISYIAFVAGYVLFNIKLNKIDYLKNDNEIKYNKNKILKMSFIIWLVSYILSMLYLAGIGRNPIYVLTIGSKGIVQSTSIGGLLGFISNFSYCMIIPYIYIFFFSKNTFFKLIIGYLTLTVYLARGFRFIIIIMFASLIVAYYRNKKKKPSTYTIIIILTIALVFIGALGFARRDLKTGGNVDWKSFGIENIVYALESNFDIYKPFYGIVQNYPSNYEHTFGKSIFLETIMMFIPRAIWPSKPLAIDSSVLLAIRRSVSEFSILVAGMAVPNIGEYYVDFGVIGCIILMFLFGTASKWTTRFYFRKNNNLHDIILYSVILPSFLQIVIRGYTPSVFYIVLFLILPNFFIRKLN